MLWLVLLASTAHGWDDPNRMPTAHLQVTHAVGDAQPWGVRIGFDWQFALGDHCTYPGWEYRGCRQSSGLDSIWPLMGPAASVAWRGGNRFVVEVDVELGLGALEMYQFGFAPLWELVGRVGFRVDLPGSTGSVALGGFLSKSFSPRFVFPGNGRVGGGVDGLGVRIDADTAWAFGQWRPAALGLGLWSVAGARWDLQ